MNKNILIQQHLLILMIIKSNLVGIWCDVKNSRWLGPYPHSIEVTAPHVYNKEGTFIMRIKAKDTQDMESDRGTLSITMPKNKAINTPLFLQFLQNFLQNHPLIYQILQRLLKF